MDSNHTPQQIAPGQKLHDYVLEKKIGEGGMGEVWRAAHPVIGKKVAIKLLSGELSSNQIAVGRFTQEARAVNEIRHRNIVDIFAFGELPDRRPYLIMEYLDGQSLGDAIAQRGPFSYAETAHILEQVCKALGAAHERGIVHRDLKPDNLFLVPEPGAFPFVKVLDFGIAKLHLVTPGAVATRAGSVFGTPGYMSPEQCESTKDVDARSDIYALGVILYEMLSGRLPFEAADGDSFASLVVRQLTTPAPPLSSLIPNRNIPRELDAFLLDVLARDPAQRPTTCSDLYRGFVAAVGPAMRDTKPESGPPAALVAAQAVNPRAPTNPQGASVTGFASLASIIEPEPYRGATRPPMAHTAPSLSDQATGALATEVAMPAFSRDEPAPSTPSDTGAASSTARAIPARAAAPAARHQTTAQLAEPAPLASPKAATPSDTTREPSKPNKTALYAVPVVLALLLLGYFLLPGKETKPGAAPSVTPNATPGPAGATPSVFGNPATPAPTPPPVPAGPTVSIRVSSDPPGADVFVDNELKGKTPFTLTMPQDEREHSLKVEKAGFLAREVSFPAQPGIESINVPMVPNVPMYVPSEEPGRVLQWGGGRRDD